MRKVVVRYSQRILWLRFLFMKKAKHHQYSAQRGVPSVHLTYGYKRLRRQTLTDGDRPARLTVEQHLVHWRGYPGKGVCERQHAKKHCECERDSTQRSTASAREKARKEALRVRERKH